MTAAPITPAEIENWEKLCEAATDEPWSWEVDDDDITDVYRLLPAKKHDDAVIWPYVFDDGPRVRIGFADRAFIATARTALPRLLAEVKANKARCVKLEAVIKPFAKYAERVAASIPDTAKMASLPTGLGSVGKFTVGDCRRARDALKEDGP